MFGNSEHPEIKVPGKERKAVLVIFSDPPSVGQPPSDSKVELPDRVLEQAKDLVTFSHSQPHPKRRQDQIPRLSNLSVEGESDPRKDRNSEMPRGRAGQLA